MVLSAVALFWYLIATWKLQTFLLYTSWSEGTIMIYIFSELHWNSDTRSIFNHSFYKDLQIEGIFDVLSRLAINQGVGSPVTLTSLWFINSWQNITLIRQPSKSKHSHCLCYQRNLHWDVARRCGYDRMWPSICSYASTLPLSISQHHPFYLSVLPPFSWDWNAQTLFLMVCFVVWLKPGDCWTKPVLLEPVQINV